MARRNETDVVEDLVRQYLREIGAYPLLTAADEVELGAAIAAGRDAEAELTVGSDAGNLTAGRRRQLERTAADGHAAKRRFIQANLRLVVSIAKRYQSAGLPLLDLVQEGNLGLIRAVEKFDHDRGCKFSTYATWWIRQSISRAIADKGRTIRVPVHMLDTVRRVNKSAARLADAYGREATLEEIARDTGLSPVLVEEARDLLPDPVSLQAPVGEDEGELGDLIEDRNAEVPFERAAASMQSVTVRDALCRLSQREREVLALRFGLTGGEPRTLEQVGDLFQLTRERIRQIEAKALTKLRHPASPPGLRGLVGAVQPRRRAEIALLS